MRITQYLEENLGGARVQLTSEDVKQVREEASKADAGIIGPRYPPASLALMFGDTPELA